MTALIRSRVPAHASLATFMVERATATGHPPLPGEQARKALRCEVQPRTSASEPIAWTHASGNAWAAVDRLHRGDLHDEAVALARLLRWTEQNFTHQQVHCWTLEDA